MGNQRGQRVSAEKRAECMDLVSEAVKKGVCQSKAAKFLGISDRSVQRWRHQAEDQRKGPLSKPANALTEEEENHILEVANSPEFADKTPWQIVAILSDRGEYLASEATFYRILRKAKCLAHRLKSHPKQHKKPEPLVATEPNQVWSWDITYLKTSIKGVFYYLYLPMDVFSRMIVHWEIHESESAETAAKMIRTAYEKQSIKLGQLKLHSDNGNPMKGATMLATLQRLGVVPSFSRPRVSDDNPFSESLFKTLKHCPSYPEHGFKSIEDARAWVEKFVHWYNHEHLHSEIQWVSPASRHQNLDQDILAQRANVYRMARLKNPNRWSRQARSWARPSVVELNPGRKVYELESYKPYAAAAS